MLGIKDVALEAKDVKKIKNEEPENFDEKIELTAENFQREI